MGTASSFPFRKEPEELSDNAHESNRVRERLRKEFGHDYDENGNDPAPQSTGINLSAMPGVFKAKSRFLKALKRGSEPKETNINKKPDSHALVKELYRRMDPSVTVSEAGRICGELQLAVKYKYETGSLLVKVGKGKDIKIQDAHKLPDPYVQVQLFTPRNCNHPCQRTKQKWNTSNPVYGEILVFPLPEAFLADTKLKFTVWSKDKISEDDFLGEVILKLCKLDLINGFPQWYSLNPETDTTVTGSIDITLKYMLPHNLIITLHEAHGLKPTNQEENTSNPYVRCLITGIETRHMTAVVPDTLDPIFEETFKFEVYREDLEYRVLVINILSKGRSEKDKRLGDVHIPLAEMEEGEMPRATYELNDLRNTPHNRKQWSNEGIAAEFREAMRAHIVYQFPKFLFKDDPKGRKVISVSSTKARLSANIAVNNGFPTDR